MDTHGYLAELGAKVEISGVTGESSSAAIFDSGKPGLDFLAAFGPAYAKFTGTSHQDFARRYDEQREINFVRLRADAERYAKIQERIADTVIDVRNSGSTVFEAWRGAAAGSANARFTSFIQQAKQIQEQFGRLAETITVVVDAADRICYEKAAAVYELRATKIGPCAPADVDFLVDFDPRCATGNVHDDELTRVAGLCGLDIVPAACRSDPQLLAKVAADVNGWLAHVFVPFYAARQAKFDAACQAASDTLTIAWGGLGEELSQVRADHFAEPGQVATPTQAAEQTAGTPQRQPADSAEAPSTSVDEPHAESGRATGRSELMTPSGFTAPSTPTPIAAPAASQVAAGGYGNTFLGGIPFLGAPGGGDHERRRSVPLAGEEIFPDHPDDSGLVIGGVGDDSHYNEEDTQAAEQPVEKPENDEEEDLW